MKLPSTSFGILTVAATLLAASTASADETRAATERHVDVPMVVGGSLAFAGGYGAQLVVARGLEAKSPAYYVPLAGPALVVADTASYVVSGDYKKSEYPEIAVFFSAIIDVVAVADLVVEAGGLAAVTIGLVGSKPPARERAGWTVVPVATASGGGVGVGGRF